MALYSPKDTLAHHSARVFTQHRNMGDVPAARVAAAVKVYMDTVGPVVPPETEALWFYGMNHGIALIAETRAPYEPLDAFEQEFVAAYHNTLCPRAVRAFYYLLAICTREFRHCKNLSGIAIEAGAKFGKPLGPWLMDVGGEDAILNKFLSSPPAVTIGAYTRALTWGFYNGSFSSGYGGPAWGRVADCLERFVDGTYSPEMMMDTVWTLSHNNGPIFNKGMLYQHHTSQLIQLLDVQRSGQIPHMIVEGYLFPNQTPGELRGRMLKLRERFPAKIGPYVDWFVVEALGSVGKYPQAKQAQVKKYGASPLAAQLAEIEAKQASAQAEKLAAEQAKIKAKLEAAQAEAELLAATQVEILPGLTLQKIKLARAA